MNVVQTPAQVDVERVVERLKKLAEHHKRAGCISHACGVQSALDLIKRERKTGKAFTPKN